MDFVTCPYCGQIQVLNQGKTCVKCKRSLFDVKEECIVRKCPYCGNLQDGGETCEKCKKSMRQPLKISIGAVGVILFFLLMSIAIIYISIRDGEIAITPIVLLFFPLLLFGGLASISIYGSFKRAGKFIEGELIEEHRRGPMVQFIFPKVQNLPGFSMNDACMVLVDTENKQVIFCQPGKPESEKYLSFQQVIDAKVETTSHNVKKSPVGRSIVGAAIAGPVGAVVGSVSGVGEKTVFSRAFIIKYRPSNMDAEEEIRFPIEGLGDLTIPKFCEKFRMELNLEKETLGSEKMTGKYL